MLPVTISTVIAKHKRGSNETLINNSFMFEYGFFIIEGNIKIIDTIDSFFHYQILSIIMKIICYRS